MLIVCLEYRFLYLCHLNLCNVKYATVQVLTWLFIICSNCCQEQTLKEEVEDAAEQIYCFLWIYVLVETNYIF